MFAFVTSIMSAVYGTITSSTGFLLSHQQNTQNIENCGNKVIPSIDYGQIAVNIYRATNKTWQIHRRTIDYTCAMSGKTLSTSSNYTSSERASSLETDATSYCEVESAILKQQLPKNIEAFQALERQYVEQLNQRLHDKAIVNKALEEVLSLQTRCNELKNAQRTSEEILQIKTDQHQKDLEDKNNELVKLADDYHSSIEDIQKSHAAGVKFTIQKAAEERRKLEAAHQEAMRALTKASNTNRCSWEKAKQSLEAEMLQMDHDFQDALQANKDEITRLTNCTYRFAAENRLLDGTLNEIPAEEMRQHALEVFEEVKHARVELEQTRKDLQVANIKVENVLEAMQQERDHWEAQAAKEQEAQAKVYDLEKQVNDLQQKLTLRNELLRAANHPSNGLKNVSIIAFENDELHGQLQVAHEANAKLQAKLNKVDDENFNLCMKLDMVEADLHNTQNKLQMLQEKQSLIDKEHQLLFNAVEKHEALTAEDKEVLQNHLGVTTVSNDFLREKNEELKKKNAELDNYALTIEEKCAIQVSKAEREAEFWQNLYWGEAVPKVELLTKEIHELNKELGRKDVYVQESLERNVVVANRNALRYACEYSLRGVDDDLIPAEFYEPGFIPGWLPATHDALRTLRPLGWAPVAELGKVWLAPMYKPFTEEDAVERLEAQKQTARKEHRANMNAPLPPEADFDTPYDGTNANQSSVRSTRSTPQLVLHEPYVPAYQSCWINKRPEMTRKAYEGMDPDLKLNVLRIIGIKADEQENGNEDMFEGSQPEKKGYNMEEGSEREARVKTG